MKQLNKEVNQHFNSEDRYPTIKVSTSDDVGEGEHKIFQHIRENPSHKEETTVVYGLDTDLIMLSIYHLPLCKKLYLFRETPSLSNLSIVIRTQ